MSKYQDLTEYEESVDRDRVRDAKRKTEGRAKRRFAAAKAKKKIVRNLKNNWSDLDDSLIGDPRYVGKQAAVHGAACSCTQCASPRKLYGNGRAGKSFQELRSEGGCDGEE